MLDFTHVLAGHRSAHALAAYGAVTSLARPLTFTNLTLPAANRLVPYGADPASWPPETSARDVG